MPRASRPCRIPGCPHPQPCPVAQHRDSRPSSRQRGYDSRHDREARAAKAEAVRLGLLCPRCGEPMREGQALDSGHTIDRAIDPTSRADRVEHATCNRRAGGQLAHQLRP